MTNPIIKWAGGKRRIANLLQNHFPRRFGTYYEPFVGGAALFLQTRPPRAVLSDANERLIRMYRAVRDQPDAVIELLRDYPNEPAFFDDMRQRSRHIDEASDIEVGAWFIYLNRIGFNDLYRVNKQNHFNVPFGNYDDPPICDEALLRSCSAALQGVTLKSSIFEVALRSAKRGDFVYADPPYLPVSATSSFTGYTASGFGLDEHRRLRDLALELAKRGVHVLISNSAVPTVLELYQASVFYVQSIAAGRNIAARAASRGPVKELLISTYPIAPVLRAADGLTD